MLGFNSSKNYGENLCAGLNKRTESVLKSKTITCVAKIPSHSILR